MQDPITGAYYTDGSKSKLEFVPETVKTFLIEKSVRIIKGGSKETAAFRECRQLQSLNFSQECNLVSIESFGCWKLTIDILDLRNCTLLTEISTGAFHRSSFSRVFLPPNLLSVKTAALSECKKLEHIDFPDSVTSIGGYSSDGGPFQGCSKLSINFSKNSHLQSIDSVGFGYSYMPDIYIPQNLTYLGNKVFAGTNSKTITVHPLNPRYKAGKDCLLSKDGTILIFALCSINGEFVIPDGVKSTAQGAFASSLFESIQVPSSVTTLEYQSFSCMSCLSSFEMTDSITSVGNDLFELCQKLKSVRLSSKLEKISTRMFVSCTSLERIEIPRGCQTISERSFYGCIYLVYVFIPNTVVIIDSACFAKTHSNITIEFENNSIFSIQNQVLYNANGSELIQFIGEASEGFQFRVGPKIEKILQSSFEEVSIEGLIFDYSTTVLKDIGSKAFFRNGLKSVLLPSTIDSIGESAFEECAQLQSISFNEEPINYRSISKRAFASSALMSFIVPSSVGSILDEAFIWCSSLKNVTFNSELKSIGQMSFGYTGLTSLTLPPALSELGISSFAGSSISWVLFDCLDLVEIPLGCFKECRSLGSVSLANSIQFVRSESFASCSILSSVSIGEKVSVVETRSFSNCPNLKSISFGDRSSITAIYASAFSGCPSLNVLNVPNSNSQLSTEDDLLFDKSHSKIIFSLPNRNNANVVIQPTVETIASGAFEECLSLLTLSVDPAPEGSFCLKTIGFQAFYNCKSLRHIFIPPSLSSVGSSAFLGAGSTPTTKQTLCGMHSRGRFGSMPDCSVHNE